MRRDNNALLRVPFPVQVLLCIALVLSVSHLTGAPDTAPHLLSFLVVAAIGVGWATHGARVHRAELGAAGFLLVAALSVWLIGDVGWVLDVLVLDREPFPSWADGFFLATYPALLAAGLVLLRQRETRPDAAAIIDTLIITIGVGILAFAFLIADAARDDTTTWAARAVGVMYPVFDIMIAGVVARLLVGSHDKSRAALLLVAGATSLLLADLGFVVAVFTGFTGNIDVWIDTAYLMFFLAVGLALRQRDAAKVSHKPTSHVDRVSAVRMAALGASALVVPATLLIGDVTNDAVKLRGVTVGAALLFLLVMVRMRLLIRAVEQKSDLLGTLARTDFLTGLPNRRTFDFELERIVGAQLIKLIPRPVSLAMIDLDWFKDFNDTHGHGGGDDLLRQAADAWRTELHARAPTATLARYGGEEFAIVFPGLVEKDAVHVVDRLLAVTPKGQSFSAGVVQWHLGEMPKATVARADLRLYQAKANGRAQVVGAGLESAA